MTEEEKAKAFDQLPREIRECLLSLSIMSDSWSRDIHDLLSAVIWDRDKKKLFDLKRKLSDRVTNQLKISQDEGRLSAIPKEVLQELLNDLKDIDRWKYKAESMIHEALRIQEKKSTL